MSVEERIKEIIFKHEVVVFMKGTPDSPQCGFSGGVVQIMAELQVSYHSVDVLDDRDIRDGIKKFSSWPTIPQVYVKGEFLGGFDIIKEIFEADELGAALGRP